MIWPVLSGNCFVLQKIASFGSPVHVYRQIFVPIDKIAVESRGVMKTFCFSSLCFFPSNQYTLPLIFDHFLACQQPSIYQSAWGTICFQDYNCYGPESGKYTPKTMRKFQGQSMQLRQERCRENIPTASTHESTLSGWSAVEYGSQPRSGSKNSSDLPDLGKRHEGTVVPNAFFVTSF